MPLFVVPIFIGLLLLLLMRQRQIMLNQRIIDANRRLLEQRRIQIQSNEHSKNSRS